MQIEDFLSRTGGIDTMARELGLSQQQAQAGATALLPAILGGLGKRAPAASDGLGDLVEQLGGASLLDDVLSPQPTPVGRGNDILAQIFGSKDVSRTVASHAASRTGLDPSMLKKMLPILAMLVSGYLAKRRGQAGASGLGGSALGGAGLGSVLGGLGAMLDADGNGNSLDDILRMAARSRG